MFITLAFGYSRNSMFSKEVVYFAHIFPHQETDVGNLLAEQALFNIQQLTIFAKKTNIKIKAYFLKFSTSTKKFQMQPEN